MKNNLLVHAATAKDLKNFTQNPSPFLILVGPAGAGKLSLAVQVGSDLLGEPITAQHPKVLHLGILPNKSEISIDQVREAISKLKLTSTGKGAIRRVVLIENGQYLSEEAQNALLKTLEEPPADTLIIMTVDSAGSVLDTIPSRAHLIEVRPIEFQAAQNHYQDEFSADKIKKTWMLADGLAGLTNALLDRAEEHELKTAVSDAKNFIASSKYQRLVKADQFTKNRRQLELLIEGLQKVVKTVHRQSIVDGKNINQQRIIAARRQLDELEAALRANVSAKTIYLKMCLNLGF